MMKHTKESMRPCTNCATPLPRQNYKHYIRRCKGCFETICSNCSFTGMCHSCFMGANQEIETAQYFIEKYGKVTT